MVGKGEIMRYTYKTIGEIPPFSTIPHYPYLWTIRCHTLPDLQPVNATKRHEHMKSTYNFFG